MEKIKCRAESIFSDLKNRGKIENKRSYSFDKAEIDFPDLRKGDSCKAAYGSIQKKKCEKRQNSLFFRKVYNFYFFQLIPIKPPRAIDKPRGLLYNT